MSRRRNDSDDDDYNQDAMLVDDDEDYIEGSTAKSSSKSKQGASANVRSSTSNVKGYSWEDEYKRSWDTLQEDSTGSLSTAVENVLAASKRRRLFRDTSAIQRGIIRHLFLVIDVSNAMAEKDLRPSRIELTLQYARELVTEYYDQNPISQLGIIITRDGLAEKLTELNGRNGLLLVDFADS